MTILEEEHAFSSDLFTVSGGTIVAEASTIGFRQFFRIYDDAEDIGIAVKSTRTGTTVRYFWASTDHSGEDVAGWRFKPIPEDERRIAACRGTEVLIIND